MKRVILAGLFLTLIGGACGDETPHDDFLVRVCNAGTNPARVDVQLSYTHTQWTLDLGECQSAYYVEYQGDGKAEYSVQAADGAAYLARLQQVKSGIAAAMVDHNAPLVTWQALKDVKNERVTSDSAGAGTAVSGTLRAGETATVSVKPGQDGKWNPGPVTVVTPEPTKASPSP